MKQRISAFIDFFYPPFKRLMPPDTFRYAACGGMNTLLGLFVFYISYHYIFDKALVDLDLFVFTPYTSALIVSGFVSFSVGFLLNKFIVFTGSNLRGRIQLFRYLFSFFFNISLNWVMLKLFVDIFNQDPFASQIIITAIVITISYFSQKHFTFKVK